MTDSDVTKPENLAVMQCYIDDMEVRISNHANDLPKEFQIYLEPYSKSMAKYYMINHDRDRRCIFWIDKLVLQYRVNRDSGLHTLSHWRACLHLQSSV